MTPFHVACARGNWPVVQFLLQGALLAGLKLSRRIADIHSN
jgi:hypothetical protein